MLVITLSELQLFDDPTLDGDQHHLQQQRHQTYDYWLTIQTLLKRDGSHTSVVRDGVRFQSVLGCCIDTTT